MSTNELAQARVRSQDGALSFENTVNPAAVQQMLMNLRFSEARAKERNETTASYTAALSLINGVLSEIIGGSIRIEVEPGFEPVLQVVLNGQSLNLSQLPDGARNVLGWFVDFVRRIETREWPEELKARQPAVLLIDEIDAHLHPRWQRRILPALQKAFKDREVQIIVTTHSPFVISSCPGARVHVLDVDEKGHATARPPVEAPVGQSLEATIKDVFGVDSRFDIGTEEQLKRWNELRKRESAGVLAAGEAEQLTELVSTLEAKSEELRFLVGTVPTLPESLVKDLMLE